jgi:uncharacterized protein YndB with AHSA1/START domain
MSKPSFVYVTYIRSTPDKVWQALTDPAITERYWYGFRVAANGRAGEYMTAIDPDGKEVIVMSFWSAIRRAASPMRGVRSMTSSKTSGLRA